MHANMTNQFDQIGTRGLRTQDPGPNLAKSIGQICIHKNNSRASRTSLSGDRGIEKYHHLDQVAELWNASC